ncbi:MAG: hypothetical protein HYX32_01635 [Actinobacteria bacterium]|nr:hypothetical protein [Actinomycetota bacterium]
MSRRLEVELTSQRDDGTWTWRAAGAKQPKGDLDGSLLPGESKIGDVLRVDADVAIDGIVITAVLPPEKARREPQRLQIIGPPRREQGVTTTLAPKGGRGERRERGEGGDRDRDDRRRGAAQKARGEARERGGRPAPGRRERGERGDGRHRERSPGSERPVDTRPRAKRLKASRKHRNAALRALSEEQQPLAEQVLRGGVPGVRLTIDRLNELAKAEGRPPVDAEKLVVLAERLLPYLRGAEWHDRAEAALAQLDSVDLGDLRSVVNAADTWARDEQTRALAHDLREGLPKRVEREHHEWLEEITSTLSDGRVVRALRLSSRPPKAGSPLPADVAGRLADAAAAGLSADSSPDRYATVVDALALSPVHNQVIPTGRPEHATDQLLSTVRRCAKQLPQIAALFGIESLPSALRSGRPARPARPAPTPSASAPVPPPPALPKPAPPAERD